MLVLWSGTRRRGTEVHMISVWDLIANQSSGCPSIPNLADEAIHFGCRFNQIVDDRVVRRTYLQSGPQLVLALEELKCTNAGNILLYGFAPRGTDTTSIVKIPST
jgi:hypothetical protein